MRFARLPSSLLLVSMIALAMGTARASEILRRTPGSWLYGPEPLYTVIGAGPASVVTFFPMSDPVGTAGLLGARFSYQMTQDSGDCKLRPAVRYSNDGVNWDTPKEVNATYATNETPIYGTAYVDLMTLMNTPPRAYIQFGLQTLNRSTTTNAFCRGTLRVEPQQKQ